jgi:hypothetical protein
MIEYRERAKERLEATPAVTNITNAVRSTGTPGYMSLVEVYGLKDMQIGASDDVEGQTVEQEFQAYVTVALSKPGTDILKFWEVSKSV